MSDELKSLGDGPPRQAVRALRGECCRIEVNRLPLVAREERERLRFEDRGLVIVAGEGADGSERVEAREGYEGDLVVLQTAQDVRAAEARDLPHRRKSSPSRNRSYASALSTVVQPRQRRVIM